eukprot:TRINITY_DN8979_c0_g1_i1.p1 TRINITY_DN8979_c0_g1~~TRINITY_DN8979_c0_g1_i1.p1  ORF type:complete len:607 (-),score=121.70 TRINITY_DN8979_c0_g1_i1:69-1868(-)
MTCTECTKHKTLSALLKKEYKTLKDSTALLQQEAADAQAELLRLRTLLADNERQAATAPVSELEQCKKLIAELQSQLTRVSAERDSAFDRCKAAIAASHESQEGTLKLKAERNKWKRKFEQQQSDLLTATTKEARAQEDLDRLRSEFAALETQHQQSLRRVAELEEDIRAMRQRSPTAFGKLFQGNKQSSEQLDWRDQRIQELVNQKTQISELAHSVQKREEQLAKEAHRLREDLTMMRQALDQANLRVQSAEEEVLRVGDAVRTSVLEQAQQALSEQQEDATLRDKLLEITGNASESTVSVAQADQLLKELESRRKERTAYLAALSSSAKAEAELRQVVLQHELELETEKQHHRELHSSWDLKREALENAKADLVSEKQRLEQTIVHLEQKLRAQEQDWAGKIQQIMSFTTEITRVCKAGSASLEPPAVPVSPIVVPPLLIPSPRRPLSDETRYDGPPPPEGPRRRATRQSVAQETSNADEAEKWRQEVSRLSVTCKELQRTVAELRSQQHATNQGGDATRAHNAPAKKQPPRSRANSGKQGVPKNSAGRTLDRSWRTVHRKRADSHESTDHDGGSPGRLTRRHRLVIRQTSSNGEAP